VTSSRIIELDIVNGDQNNAKSGICVVRAAAKKKRGKKLTVDTGPTVFVLL